VEWDAAAYTDPNNRDGWKYPTRSDDSPEGALAGLTGDVTNPGLNVANYDKSAHWNGLVGNVTTVAGAGPLSTSYWGTYDQGGNVTEWVETLSIGNRWLRGGSYHDDKNDLRSDAVLTAPHDIERPDIGFRVASPSF
jgi:formylglycine-generating enzyme required for sulfatase activity